MKHFAALLGLVCTFYAPAAFAQSLVDKEAEGTAGATATRLDCKPIVGQVIDADGHPLIGATLLVKGTTNAYMTDGDGNYHITAPVYKKQVLAVEAAGYLPRLITLTTCQLPVVALERDPAVRIKRTGKRAGQVVQ